MVSTLGWLRAVDDYPNHFSRYLSSAPLLLQGTIFLIHLVVTMIKNSTLSTSALQERSLNVAGKTLVLAPRNIDAGDLDWSGHRLMTCYHTLVKDTDLNTG